MRKKIFFEGKNDKMDRISNLPVELLSHILSLLPSTKEAIRTSVLSKRWQLVWTHVPKLIFLQGDFINCSSRNLDTISEYVVPCIDKTLSLHSSAKVEKFHFEHENYDFEELMSSPLDSWLLFAVQKEVKDLTLKMTCEGLYYEVDNYYLPQFLYQCPSLIKLSTEFCQFTPNGRVSWESLRDLRMEFAKLTTELIDNILHGAPLLHSLELHDCSGFHRLDLSRNAHLKKLVMTKDEDRNCSNDGADPLLQISGPYLEDLEIVGSWNIVNLELINISSVVKIVLNFDVIEYHNYNDDHYQEVAWRLLRNVSHIEQLTLGNWCVQVLSKWNQCLMESLSSSRKSLILNIRTFDLESMRGIKKLLLSSHKLEKLVITLGYYEYWSHSPAPKSHISPADEFWSPDEEEDFNCLEFHLKNILITGFKKNAGYSYNNCLYVFIKFLLAKAKVLESMVLRDLTKNPSEMLFVARKLLRLQRASPSAVLIL